MSSLRNARAFPKNTECDGTNQHSTTPYTKCKRCAFKNNSFFQKLSNETHEQFCLTFLTDN